MVFITINTFNLYIDVILIYVYMFHVLAASSLPLPVPEVTPHHPRVDKLPPPSQGPAPGSGEGSTGQSKL